MTSFGVRVMTMFGYSLNPPTHKMSRTSTTENRLEDRNNDLKKPWTLVLGATPELRDEYHRFPNRNEYLDNTNGTSSDVWVREKNALCGENKSKEQMQAITFCDFEKAKLRNHIRKSSIA